MLRSFKCKYTEKLYQGKFVKRFSSIRRQAERRLRLLDEAETSEGTGKFSQQPL